MAFNPIGAVNWLEKADAAQAAKKKDEDAKEVLAFELAMKYGTGTLAGSSSTKSGGSAANSSNEATNVLIKKYNLSNDALAPIIASGDRTATPKLLKTLETQRLKYEEKGLKLPEDVISEIVESIVITEAEDTGKVDISKLEKFIGREMDSLYKDLLIQQKSTGSVYIPERAFVEAPSLEDLDRFEQRAISANLSRAKQDKSKITTKLGELTSIAETSGLNDAQLAEQQWLTNRLGEIDSALEANKNEDVTDLAGLYGTAYIDQLKNYYGNFKDAPLNPALLNSAQKDITVPNRNVAQQLYQAGILKDGDIVINMETGKKIRIGG